MYKRQTTYGEDSEDGEMLTAYMDSDHAGDLETGYSTTKVVLYFAGGLDAHETNGGGEFDGRSRMRRHVKKK